MLRQSVFCCTSPKWKPKSPRRRALLGQCRGTDSSRSIHQCKAQGRQKLLRKSRRCRWVGTSGTRRTSERSIACWLSQVDALRCAHFHRNLYSWETPLYKTRSPIVGADNQLVLIHQVCLLDLHAWRDSVSFKELPQQPSKHAPSPTMAYILRGKKTRQQCSIFPGS